MLVSTFSRVGHSTLAKPYVVVFLFQTYSCLSAGEFQLIRQTLLIFFQDMHIRVRAQYNYSVRTEGSLWLEYEGILSYLHCKFGFVTQAFSHLDVLAISIFKILQIEHIYYNNTQF